jgi:uncharacterized membrane protein
MPTGGNDGKLSTMFSGISPGLSLIPPEHPSGILFGKGMVFIPVKVDFFLQNFISFKYYFMSELIVSATNKKNVQTMERIISLLSGSAIILHAVRKKNRLLVPELIAGSYLFYRGYSGNCPVRELIERNRESGKVVNAKVNVTVNKPRAEVYRLWRNLSNLPLFMKHVESVHQVDSQVSDWTISVPGYLKTINWKAELVKEIPSELLAWKSLPGADIENAGKIEFHDALGKHGTEIRATLSYHPPFGKAGEKISHLFNPLFKKTITADLNNFKNFAESVS